ncbi:MAG: adenylate/guanylate cyclase domain-containing protein [Actinomycetota bacterium]|nr:adenylate/guanylate cyclase domain-containing protein [Actinomycetota bacterium]
MEPSEEISDLLLEVYRAYANADAAAFLSLWSTRPGVMSVGTDPREWWRGFEIIKAAEEAQMMERRPTPVAPAQTFGFQEGSVGWATGSATGEFRGKQYPMRWVLIAHLEREKWKIVYLCRSHEVLNEELVGVTFTTKIDSIAEAVGVERPELTRATAPDGTVTLLFTDIEGSSQLTELLGDRQWLALLHQHNAVVREQTSLHKGFEVKSEGDGFMLAFSSAREALRCAIGIQRALITTALGLRIRIGLHTGEAIKESQDFFGRAVVLAARIAGEARGSEILASGVVRDLAEGTGEFSFNPPTEVELRGLNGIHRLSGVRWQQDNS